MKCTNNAKRARALLLVSVIALTGCGRQPSFSKDYDIENAKVGFEMTVTADDAVAELFAENLCVLTPDTVLSTDVNLDLSEAGALFDIQAGNVVYEKNLYEKLYPASITKNLTAYIALKYGNLTDVLTVSENAVITESGAQLCGFMPGDKITLEQALYGLLIYSGNDAAVVIAEYISGSVEEFAALMNEEAKKLGATGSNFVNPHGLNDENHYSTVYDIYLIFQEVIKNQTYLDIIQTKSYTTTYTLSDGTVMEKTWNTTNKFLNGDVKTPENTVVLGGKTGTTEKARSCLVILSQNSDLKPYVSIILKSQDRSTLYTEMTELLNQINK